jgi:SNF2 family DNA or RNA helicase
MKPPKMYTHQHECLAASRDRVCFAILLEQGLGKTRVALETFRHLTLKRVVDGMLVIAPNGVHVNWTRREIPQHFDLGAEVVTWESHRSDTTKKFAGAWASLLASVRPVIFSVNVEALSSGLRAYARVDEFLRKRRCLMVVDESSRVKTPNAQRTKRVLRLARLAPYRRIMSGTPVTQSPFDIYTQFALLDPAILGYTSFHAFKHHFGVWRRELARCPGRSWQYETLVKYVNLEELKSLVAGHSYRRTKAQCLDLPPKVYQRITLDPTPEQSRFYKAIEDEGTLDFEGFELLAPLQITRLLRCQQITGGFLPFPTNEDAYAVSVHPKWVSHDWKPLPGTNPKLDYLLEATEGEYQGKTIVWARFRAEIAAIAAALRKKFGAESVVELHGGVLGLARQASIDDFQRPEGARFLVGQQQSGVGVTLTAAHNVFYYSNTFSYEQRIQSEDRAHRIGQKESVIYVDLEIGGTVDERVRDVIAKAADCAAYVVGDRGVA